MQRIRVKKVQPVGNGGTAIYDENGTRYSGFQPELRCVGAGDILGIGVEAKGGYNNITAVKIIEYGTAMIPGGRNHSDENMTSTLNELKMILRQAQDERRGVEPRPEILPFGLVRFYSPQVAQGKLLRSIQNDNKGKGASPTELSESIEAQTAFKGIVELACHLPAEGKLGVAYEKALDWALARLGGRVGPKSILPLAKPVEKNPVIDTEWLKKALMTLQDSGTPGWSNAAVVASLNRVTGGNARSVSEAIKPLNRKQAVQFVREVRLALERG